MNLKYSDITNILERAVECVEYYENELLNNKLFTLYLANGERVKFSIAPQNLAHLLGINLYAIKDIIKFSSDDPIKMLKELPEMSYELSKKFKCGILKETDVFSVHIEDKLNNFKNNITGNVVKLLEETILVCSYKSEKSWEVTTKNQKWDYVIIRKLDNGKIGILCLVKNKNQCYAMSNQVPENDAKLDEFLSETISNQEITFLAGADVNNLLTENKYTKNLFSGQKITKSRVLKQYRDKYKCNIDIFSDYEYAVGKLGNNRNERIENKNSIENIVDAIVNNSLINVDDIEDTMLLNIVNTWNDHVCKVGTNTSNDGEKTYTELKKELNKFKALVATLKERNGDLENRVNNLTETNEKLEQSNKENENALNSIYEIIKPRIN